MSFSNSNKKRNSQTLRTTRYNDYEDNKQMNFHNLTFDYGSNSKTQNISRHIGSDDLKNKHVKNNFYKSKSRDNSKELKNEKSPNKNPTNEGCSKSKERIQPNKRLSSKPTNSINEYDYSEEENELNYKKLLEKKIKNQAERLYELQNYKEVMEKRILQLNPNEILPLTESKADIDYVSTAHFNDSNKFDNITNTKNVSNNRICNNNNRNKQNDITFNCSPNYKDAFTNLQNENDFLKLRITNLEKEKEILRNFNSESKKAQLIDNDNEMLDLDRIPNENLREAYLNLQSYCNKIQKEKENIMQSLNQEVILSEEQRNYIEILKKIVENSIINNDLVDLLQQQRNFNNPQNKPMIEYICDISNLQKELENKLKVALEYNNTIKRLEKEIALLKQINLENDLKREKIIENLKIGMNELEETNIHVKKLETERINLSAELSLIKPEYEDLKILKKINCEKLNELEKTLIEKENVISDLNKLVDQQSLLEEKLLEYKDRFVMQHNEFERVLLEKDNLEKLNYSMEEKIKKFEFAIKEKDLILKEIEDKLAVYKNLFEDEKKKLINFQNNFKDKEFEMNKEINKVINLLDENAKKLEKMNKENSDLNKKLRNKIEENDELNEEIIKIKNENALFNIEIAKLNDKLTDAVKKEKNYSDKIEMLNKDYFDVKQKYDIACFDLEDSKKNLEECEKELEIFKNEKNQFLNLYEKEKKDVQLKESLIKALENEIHLKSALISTFNKISNLSFVNLKASFKNILNLFNSYHVKLSGIKNKLLILNDAEQINEDDAFNIFNYNKLDFKDEKNKFNDNNFNFKRYVGKDKDTLISNMDRKSNQRNFNLNDIYNNPSKNFVDNQNKKKNDLVSYIKEITYSMESFGEWMDIIKDEINSNLCIINDYEKSILNNKSDNLKVIVNTNNKEIIDDNKIESTQGTMQDSKKMYQNANNILQEEITKLKLLNSEYKFKYEKLMKDLKSFRNDNKKLYDNNKFLKENFNNKLNLYEKEILFQKNLILKIANFIKNVYIKTYIEQILEANDFISGYELERLKLVKNLEKYEDELKAFIDKELKNVESSDNYSELKLKVSNAKNKLSEINRKIQDKKSEIIILESKINKEKDHIEISEDNNHRNYLNSLNKKDLMNTPIVEKFSKLHNENLLINKFNKPSPKDHIVKKFHSNEFAEENQISNANNYEYEIEKEKSLDQCEFEEEKDCQQDENDENINYLKMENNTVNEFFNNNKATNVFKKNYVDSNKHFEQEIINKQDKEKEKEIIKLNSNSNKDNTENNSLDNLNFDYKKSQIVNEDIIRKETNDNSEKKEFEEENYFYNRNKANSKSKKKEGICIDTDKINEKYDKLLNKISNEAKKDIIKPETNSLLIDRNMEYKLKDYSKPFSNFKSEMDEIINKDKAQKINEIPKSLNSNKNINNLNYNYDLDNDRLDNKKILDRNSNNTNKDYHFDYKRNLNSERNKRDNKKNFKNSLTDDIDKFGKSPQKVSNKNAEAKKDFVDPNSNKYNYGCNNNFTFNNNEETENSIDSKPSKKSSKNLKDEDLMEEKVESIKEIQNLESENLKVINPPKKRGFGKRNFDIDI